jgi:phage baseplate assembly protein V
MSKIHGVVTGKVKNVKDPDNQGRVQVSLPYLGGQNDSTWAPVATLMAGGSRGSWFMPEVGDEVLVAFNQEDVAHPFIVGFLWNGQDKPPEADNKIRTLVTPGGHSLRFEDADGSKKVIVKSSSNMTITLDDTESSITLQGGGRILKMSGGLVQIS